METFTFDFKKHLSKSLQTLWRFKDYEIVNVETLDGNKILVNFRAKHRFLYSLLGLVHKKDVPLSGYVSVRLVFIASIIGAGYVYKKDKKDGEVIVLNYHIDFNKPIMYNKDSIIPIFVEIHKLKEKDKYHLFEAKFSIGNNLEQVGTSTFFYCKPDLKDFSYL